MGKMLKEEIFTTVKKKRFIILMALLYIGTIVLVICSKTGFSNDLTCFLAMRNIVNTVFDPAAGAVLLLSVYRRKYTRTSILQAEEHGLKRGTAVITRAAAGSIILAVSYIILAVILVLSGLIAGAGLSAEQTGMLLADILTSCIASVTVYVGVLLWLYLFAFPLVPMALFAGFLRLPYLVFVESVFLDNIYSKVLSYVLPKAGMDVFAASLIYHNPKWIYVLICIACIVVTLLLTMLVFKLKKLKEAKGEETEGAGEETT